MRSSVTNRSKATLTRTRIVERFFTSNRARNGDRLSISICRPFTKNVADWTPGPEAACSHDAAATPASGGEAYGRARPAACARARDEVVQPRSERRLQRVVRGIGVLALKLVRILAQVVELAVAVRVLRVLVVLRPDPVEVARTR